MSPSSKRSPGAHLVSTAFTLVPAPASHGSGPGRYVGRVGALAVALGVGFAVATGQGVGVARADDTNSSSSSSDTSSDSAGPTSSDTTSPSGATDPDPSGPPTPGSTSNEHSDSDSGPKVPKMNVQVSGTATVKGEADDEKDTGHVPAAQDEDAVDAATEPATDADPGNGSTPDVDPAEVAPVVPVSDPKPADPVRNDAPVASTQEPSSTVVQHDSEPTDQPRPQIRPAVAPQQDAVAPTALRTTTPTPTPTITPPVTAPTVAPTLRPQDPVSALISLPGAILAAVLSPFLSPGPGVPVRPPLLLAVLSLVAREIERVLFNATPIIRSRQVDVTLQDPADVSQPISFGANDPDGEPLVYSVPGRGAVGGPTRGTVTIDQATGTFVYNPDDTLAATGGTDTFTVTVTDAAGAPHLHGLQGLFSFGMYGHTSTATITVNVNAVNDPPVAGDDAFTTPEDTPFAGTVLANDTDPENNPLTTTLADGPAHGTVVLQTNGTFTYTPAANYHGTDTFTYTVSDGRLTDTATVTISVTPVNDAPVAVPDTRTVAEDSGTITGNVLTNDRAANPDEVLTVTPIGLAGSDTYSVQIDADGTYTFAPATNFTGTVTVPYTVTDAAGGTATGTLTITVTPVDDPIAAVDDTVTTDEDTPVSGNVLDNDRNQNPDGPTEQLTATVVTGPTKGAVVLNLDGTFTYTPDADFHGTDSFAYRVTDSAGNVDEGIVTIVVRAVDDPLPAIGAVTVTTPEDTPLTGDLLADFQNPDGPNEPLTATVTTQPLNGVLTVDSTTGAYTYTPYRDVTGTDTFTYTISDGTHTTTGTVTITITPVDDRITAITDSYTTDEDTPVSGNVLTNDRAQNPDGPTEQLTAVVVIQPTNGTLTFHDDGTFTYVPDANFNGADTFNYAVTDASGNIDVATVIIVVNPVNDPLPPIGPVTVTTPEDTPTSGNLLTAVKAANPDGPTEVLRVTPTTGGTAQTGIVTIGANGAYTYTPATNYRGTFSTTYVVSDATTSATGVLVITVNSTPTTPTISPATLTPNQYTGVVQGTASSVDADGDPLTWSATAPTNGAVVIRPDGTFTYTPTQFARENLAPSFDTFTVTASDGKSSASTTVTVAIAPVNVLVGSANVGSQPNGVAVSADGNTAYVANQSGTTVSVIKTSDSSLIATIDVGGSPTGIAISPNGDKVYVTSQTNRSVVIIDTVNNTTAGSFVVGQNPLGIAVSPNGAKVYVAYFGGVVEYDANTRVVRPVYAGSQARGVAVSANGDTVYAAVAEGGGSVVVINPANGAVIKKVTGIGGVPNRIVLTPDGTKAYVTNAVGGLPIVSVVNLATNDVKAIDVGGPSNVLAISPDGTRLYVTNTTTNYVSVIDTASDTRIKTIDVGSVSRGVTISRDGTRLFVTTGSVGNGKLMVYAIGALGGPFAL